MVPATERLRRLGYPATRGRGEILRILDESSIPLSPREIRDRFPAPKPDASTVYRNLTLMVSLGLVRSVALHERSRRYESAGDGVHRHRAHLAEQPHGARTRQRIDADAPAHGGEAPVGLERLEDRALGAAEALACPGPGLQAHARILELRQVAEQVVAL